MFLRAIVEPLRIASATSRALPMPMPTFPSAVADDDDGAEVEAASALDDFGDAVDVDHLLGDLDFSGGAALFKNHCSIL